MAKLMCAKCGGKVTRMGNGGVTPSKAIPRASMGLNFGIPQEGTTNYSAPTMKKGGRVRAIKKMELGGDPGDKLKQFISSTKDKVKQTVKNVVRQVKDNSQQRKIKKALPKYPAIKEGLQENVQVSKSKYGGRVKKK